MKIKTEDKIGLRNALAGVIVCRDPAGTLYGMSTSVCTRPTSSPPPTLPPVPWPGVVPVPGTCPGVPPLAAEYSVTYDYYFDGVFIYSDSDIMPNGAGCFWGNEISIALGVGAWVADFSFVETQLPTSNKTSGATPEGAYPDIETDTGFGILSIRAIVVST